MPDAKSETPAAKAPAPVEEPAAPAAETPKRYVVEVEHHANYLTQLVHFKVGEVLDEVVGKYLLERKNPHIRVEDAK